MASYPPPSRHTAYGTLSRIACKRVCVCAALRHSTCVRVSIRVRACVHRVTLDGSGGYVVSCEPIVDRFGTSKRTVTIRKHHGHVTIDDPEPLFCARVLQVRARRLLSSDRFAASSRSRTLLALFKWM